MIGVYGDDKELARFGVEELSSKDSVRPYLEALKGKVDCIVLLSHSGAVRERGYARAIPGIDVIVGGPTHAALPPEGVGESVIVRAQARGAAVGVLDLEIDTELNKLHAWHFERVPVPAEDAATSPAGQDAPR